MAAGIANLATIFSKSLFGKLVTIFGKLVNLFGKLLHIFGKLVNSFGKLVRICWNYMLHLFLLRLLFAASATTSVFFSIDRCHSGDFQDHGSEEVQTIVQDYGLRGWGPCRYRRSCLLQRNETTCWTSSQNSFSPTWIVEVPQVILNVSPFTTLKTLTSLNKEVRLFLLSDNSIWNIPFVSSLGDYSIWRSWSYSSLAIIAFGAFAFIVSKYYYRLGKMEFKESSLLNLRRLRSSRNHISKVTGYALTLVMRQEIIVGSEGSCVTECTAVAAIQLRMRIRILTHPENSLANFCHQISKKAANSALRRSLLANTKGFANDIAKISSSLRKFSPFFTGLEVHRLN